MEQKSKGIFQVTDKKHFTMIHEETINGLLFQVQTTFRIYESEEDRTNGKFVLSTSNENIFNANKELAKKNEAEQKENKFIVL